MARWQNTQNYNRYGYVLNNPLLYTDASGEFFFAAVIIGAVIGGITQAIKPGANFGTILGGALIGAAAGAIGAGVGNAVGGVGFFGSKAVATTMGFGKGFASGFAGGFAGGFVGGAGNAWLGGASFGQGLVSGLKAGAIGGAAGGLINGVSSGIRAVKHGRDFWNGVDSTPHVDKLNISAEDVILSKTKPSASVDGLKPVDIRPEKLSVDTGFDIDAAVDYLNSNAKPKSIASCARYVRKAIKAGGISIDPPLRPISAKNYGIALTKKGFSNLSISNLKDYFPLKGDIAVFQPYSGGSIHGHIQMYNGSNWVSDFIQRDFWAGPGYRINKPIFSIFRW